jgi:hypothetical protein
LTRLIHVPASRHDTTGGALRISPQPVRDRVTRPFESIRAEIDRNRRTAAMAEYKHGSMDIKEQEKTFAGFMSFTMRTVMVIIVVLILMAVFLTF